MLWMCAYLQDFRELMLRFLVVKIAASISSELAAFLVTAGDVDGFAVWEFLRYAIIDVPAPAIFVAPEGSQSAPFLQINCAGSNTPTSYISFNEEGAHFW